MAVPKRPINRMGRPVKALAPDDRAAVAEAGHPPVGDPPVTHDDLVAKVVERLKSHAATSAIVADRAYTAADLPATPTLPYYFVSKGTDHGAPDVAGPVLAQADTRVESRAETEELIGTMCVACQAALNGWVDDPVQQSVLIDTGTIGEEEGYWARRDAFATFYVNTGA